MDESKVNLKQEIVNIYNRERLDITGVIEIISSTDKEINAKMEDSYLQILGEKLTISKLIPDEKLLSVNGKINGLSFSGKHTKKSILGKVFK